MWRNLIVEPYGDQGLKREVDLKIALVSLSLRNSTWPSIPPWPSLSFPPKSIGSLDIDTETVLFGKHVAQYSRAPQITAGALFLRDRVPLLTRALVFRRRLHTRFLLLPFLQCLCATPNPPGLARRTLVENSMVVAVLSRLTYWTHRAFSRPKLLLEPDSKIHPSMLTLLSQLIPQSKVMATSRFVNACGAYIYGHKTSGSLRKCTEILCVSTLSCEEIHWTPQQVPVIRDVVCCRRDQTWSLTRV